MRQRHTDRHTDRHTNIHTERQTDRHTDIHTYIHTDRQTEPNYYIDTVKLMKIRQIDLELFTKIDLRRPFRFFMCKPEVNFQCKKCQVITTI